MSALSDLAASMSVGTWAELTTSGLGTSIVSSGGPSGHVATGAHAIEYDEVRGIARGGFKDHNHPTAGMRECAYRIATNTWSFEQNFGSVGFGHAYDHNCIDPSTGIAYLTFPGKELWSCSPGGAWSLLTTWTSSQNVATANGACVWQGAFTGVTGKAVMVYQCGDNSEIIVWDIDSAVQRSTINVTDMEPLNHGFMEYSRVHNIALFGGGNNNPTSVRRLNSNGTITVLSDAPWRLGPLGVATNPAIIMEDPSGSGKFILVNGANSEVYSLDPTNTGPSAYVQLSNATVDFGNSGMFGFPVHGVGVLAYVAVLSGPTGHMYLYKYATSSPAVSKVAILLR